MCLSNDYIWNYWNLNRHISQAQLDMLFKCSGFSKRIVYYQNTED